MGMQFQNLGITAATVVVALCLSAPAQAEDNDFRFEIAPYIGYRMGGSFDEENGNGSVDINDSNAEGITFNIQANPNGQYEFLYARQSTDASTQGFFVNDPTIGIDIEYFQLGGTYVLDGNRIRPFIALTVGVTEIDPSLADTNSERFFSASFGGGVQMNPRGRLGVRLEARVYSTFTDGESNIFCSSINGAGSCLVQFDSSLVTQWEAKAGLVFRF